MDLHRGGRAASNVRRLGIVTVAVLLVVAGWASGCGGDGGTEPEPPPPPPNQRPVAVGSIPAQTVIASQTVTLDVGRYFNDPDRDALTYAATTSEPGTASPTVSGNALTIAGVSPGSAAVTVTARDPGGLSATQSVSVTVERANRAPVPMGNIPSPTVRAGETVEIALSRYFSDPDGDSVTYTASTSSASVASPTIAGTNLTIAGVSEGTATITVEARDPGGLSAEQRTTVTVERANRRPVPVDNIAARTLRIGDTVTIDVSSYFQDPDGDALTYTAASSNVAVAPATISGSTLTLAGVAVGTATVTVEARDPGGLSAEQRTTVRVRNQRPVIVSGLSDEDILVGDTITLDVSTNFRDPDGDPLDYSATTSNADVAAVSVSGSNVILVGVGVGRARIAVAAIDPGGLSASQAFSVSVVASPTPTTVTIMPDTARLSALGDTVRLRPVVRDQNGRVMVGFAVTWASSNTSVATVDASGLVTAVGYGTATVSASANSARGMAEITVANPDRAALEALYHATDGPNWKRSDNWLTDAPVKDWYGVTTDRDARVDFLLLSNNNLAGSIPPDLGNLASLSILLLDNNQLTGAIPPQLGNLADLTRLDLYNNQLTGAIPPQLGNLADLTRLYLYNNQLTGAIPPELGNLASLSFLAFYNNQLTGAIPPELGNLASITVLLLDNNQLTGTIPPQLGNLASLSFLGLAYNQLTGAIPPQLGNLASITVLLLADNQLTGAIPPELGDLAALQWLHLFENELTGQMPLELTNLTQLERFYYYNTDLCVPNDNSFLTWLNDIPDHRGTGLDCQGTTLPAPTVQVGASARVNLPYYFDQDGEGNQTYSAVTSDDRIAMVAVNQGWLWIEGVGEGAAQITVTASTPDGASAMRDATVARQTRIAIFDIAVEPAATHGSSEFKLPESEGTITKSNVFLKGVARDEYCRAESITASWRISHFFGEPIVNGSFKWEGAEDCQLTSSTVVWVRISRPGTSSHYYVRITPVIPRAGRGYGSNVAGSPDWDEFMCIPERANEPDRLFTDKEEECLSGDDARDWYRNGFVDYFYMGWSTG